MIEGGEDREPKESSGERATREDLNLRGPSHAEAQEIAAQQRAVQEGLRAEQMIADLGLDPSRKWRWSELNRLNDAKQLRERQAANNQAAADADAKAAEEFDRANEQAARTVIPRPRPQVAQVEEVEPPRPLPKGPLLESREGKMKRLAREAEEAGQASDQV